jgi:hypothetical protein
MRAARWRSQALVRQTCEPWYYCCVLFSDCTGEPLGKDFPRGNHEASLFVIQAVFGWVSDLVAFLRVLEESSTLLSAVGYLKEKSFGAD